MTSRRELKNYAKQAMSGKYGILILSFVAVQALALISSMISSALFPGEETIDIVLSYAFTFILTLLINVVAAGMNYMYLNIARGKVYSLNDLFYFYRHHPDRVIVAGFFMAVLNLLTMLPYTVYSNANLPGEDASVEDANQARLGFAELHSERNIAKLSIVGAGMMSNPGVAAKMFESLYNEGVNINMISTSEIRVTVLINEKDGVRAMNAVHDAFGLAD